MILVNIFILQNFVANFTFPGGSFQMNSFHVSPAVSFGIEVSPTVDTLPNYSPTIIFCFNNHFFNFLPCIHGGA